jgi:hypothetical protein
MDHRDFPDGIGIFSSDNVLGAIMMSWFDQRGVSCMCHVSVGHNWVHWHHDDPAFMQRLTISADRDGDRLFSKGEMARNGAE